MEFRNEEKAITLLCWFMDLLLLIMAGWIVGLIADLIRLS